MSDVAQILGLAGPQAGTGAGPAGIPAGELEQLKPTGPSPAGRMRSSSGARPKKLTGMQREVLELLESTHRASHSLYQGFSKPTLQQKWKERKQAPAVKWCVECFAAISFRLHWRRTNSCDVRSRKPFRNPARATLAGEDGEEEGLVLTHWVKSHVDPPAYVFARFNVACDVTSYSDAEFAGAIAPHHDPASKWTKDETDVLFKLCRRFDLRWVVIADRYNTNPIAKGALRSVEDIKYRYYEVTRLLDEFRGRQARKATTTLENTSTSATSTNAEAGTVSSDNGDTKTVAKAAPATTTPATPTAIANGKAATSEPHYIFNLSYEKQRKRQLELAFSRSIEEENEIRRLHDELRTVEQQLKKAAVRVDPKKKKEFADVPFEVRRSMPTGVYLRSTTLALPQQKHHALSAKFVKKLQLLLDELGVPARPMPTKPVCDMFDKLRQDGVGLLTLRKHLATKQNEVQMLRDRFQTLTGKEYKPVTTKLPRSGERWASIVALILDDSEVIVFYAAVRRGDAAAVTGGSGANTSGGVASTPTISKGTKHFVCDPD